MARFMRKGISKFFWVLTISNKSAPTAIEINAGTNITTQLAAINGLEFTNTPIEVPDMSTAFVGKIPGEDSVSDTNMEFYEDKTTNPISTALAKNTVGHIVAFYAGTAGASPAAADKAEVWPAIVASNSKMYTADNEAAKYRVVFTLTDPVVAATLV